MPFAPRIDPVKASIAAALRWADAPVIRNARLEWPAWLREQARLLCGLDE